MSIVSVVVATCGRPHELAECLDSLLDQTHPPARIVVVDDAPGGDLTPSVVRRSMQAGPVVYVEGARRGLAAAHNRGVHEVVTPLVALTDDDVIADREWLERIVDAFSSVPDVACVTGKIVAHELETPAQILLDIYARFDKGDEPRVFDLRENRPADPLFPFAAGRCGSGANMAFTRAALTEMGGFDPALGAGTPAAGGDDLAAFFEVLLRGHRVVYEPRAVVRHRHVRDTVGLERQMYGYGVGLTAYLTKCMLDRPRLVPVAARRLGPALSRALGGRSPGSAPRLPPGYPPELVRLERRGMLSGPVAYLRSRRQVRRLGGRPA